MIAGPTTGRTSHSALMTQVGSGPGLPGPTVTSRGDGGAHEPAFPSLGLPLLLLHLRTQGLVHVLRSPAMTWHPGPRQSAESEGIFGASSE